MSDRLYRDLGINGGDIIEFIEEVEREFATDLSPLVEEVRTSKGLLRTRTRVHIRDVSLGEIAEYLCAHDRC